MSLKRAIRMHLRCFVFVVGVIALGVVLVPQARAADVTVNCPPFTGGDYPNIHTALNALDLNGPHTITVKGTCQEYVRIGDGTFGRRNLAIIAAAGETATIEPPPAGAGKGNVILICGSQEITLQGLVIRGGGIGLYVCDASDIDTGSLTIENNRVAGVFVDGDSMLFLGGPVVIRDNGPTGVIVRRGSRVSFWCPCPGGAADVHGHSVWGVDAANGAVIDVLGPAQIHSNGTAGNAASGGIRIAHTSALLVAPSGPGGNPQISDNNGPGVLVETGSSVSFQGATVSNNAGAGVQVQRLSVAELTSSNTLSGNGGSAISCDNSSWVAGDLTGIKPLNCSNVAKPPK